MAEFPKFFVKEFDCNKQIISDWNILCYCENDIKKLKKKCATKVEFGERLRREFMCHYWSKAEWELIITKTENGRILLSPWCGCREPEKVTVDVTDDHSQLDWSAFANYHINRQAFKTEAKIDVYDQIMFGGRFEKLVDMLWTTRLKYERDNPKFHSVNAKKE